MRNFNASFYRVPTNPLARFALVLGGLAILALSFIVGLLFLAVAAGLAILGAIGLTIRNWLASRHKSRQPDDLQAEYRIVRRDPD